MSARRSTAVLTAGAAAGGALLGWLAERRALADLRDGGDPEAAALAEPLPARGEQLVAPDGTPLDVQVVGPEGAPTIVLVHGYALSQAAWHYQRRDLSGELRVVTYDQRGHGASGQAASGDYHIDTLAGDLATVVEWCARPGERVVVAGHSMGAMTLLALAREHPELFSQKVSGAVLVDTTGSDVYAGALASTPLARVALGLRLLAAASGAALPRLVGIPGTLGATPSDFTYFLIRAIALTPDAPPAYVGFTEGMNLSCHASVRAALIPMFTALDLVDAAGLVTVPTLLLVGERDRLTPPAASRRLHAALPHSDLVELPGVGHMTPLEAHEVVTAHLRAFARRVTAA